MDVIPENFLEAQQEAHDFNKKPWFELTEQKKKTLREQDFHKAFYQLSNIFRGLVVLYATHMKIYPLWIMQLLHYVMILNRFDY